MKIIIDERNAMHHDAPQANTTMSKTAAMEVKSIRLTKEQLAKLDTVAEQIAKKTKLKCDACVVIRMAVDDYLTALRRKLNSRKALAK